MGQGAGGLAVLAAVANCNRAKHSGETQMETTDAGVRVDPYGDPAAVAATVMPAAQNQLSIAVPLSMWVGKGTAVDQARWGIAH